MPSLSNRRQPEVIYLADAPDQRRSHRRAAGKLPVAINGDSIRRDVEAERERRRKSRMVYRLRRQLRPWYAAAGLQLFVALAWLLQVSPTDGWAAAGIGLTVTGLTAAFARGNVPTLWRGRLWTAGVLGSLWVGASIAAGPSWDPVLALTVLTIALSLGWWRHHRIGYPIGPTVSDPVDYGVVGRWAKYVANTSGPLPDSFLSDQSDTRNGEQFTVNLAPGRHTLSTALSSLDRIASGLDVPVRRFVLEQHPSGSPTKLALTVVRQSPVEQTVTYAGPDIDGGTVHLGPYADGDGMAPWRLWTPGETPNTGSWWGGVVIGGIGSGKSRLIEELSIGAMATETAVVWFIDPQGGASSPALRDHADWYVDLDGAADMLVALERIAAWRARENAANGWVGFDPSRARPGVLVVVDEAHEVFGDKDNTERWTQLARKTRKVGIGFVALSQYPGLTTFGGSEPLRAAVMAGNGVVMHAESRQNGQLMPGLAVDPLTLPKNLPGFGYTLATASSGRTAPFRAFYVTEPETWMPRYPQPALDPLAARAGGDLYTRRHEKAARERAALQADLDRMLGHAVVDHTPGGGPRPPRFPTLPESFARRSKPARPALSGAQVRVWDALGLDERTFAELVDLTGWSTTRLTSVLRQLVDAGHIVKPARGRYRRAR